MLLELFGELHPFHFEGFRLVRDGLQLLVELAQTFVIAWVVRGHLRFQIGLLFLQLGQLAFDRSDALGCLVEGLAGELRGGVLTVIGSL